MRQGRIGQKFIQQCYLITKLILLLVLGWLLYKWAVYTVSRKMHRPLGAAHTMTCIHGMRDGTSSCDMAQHMAHLR